jgi:hypothetical protein
MIMPPLSGDMTGLIAVIIGFASVILIGGKEKCQIWSQVWQE